MYLRTCDDTYLILQNKYLHIYEDSVRAKILRDDCTPSMIRFYFYDMYYTLWEPATFSTIVGHFNLMNFLKESSIIEK